MKKVRFQGEVYWLTEDGLLSPLYHFDSDGCMTVQALIDGISYAVIMGEGVWREHKQIGTISDFQEVA